MKAILSTSKEDSFPSSFETQPKMTTAVVREQPPSPPISNDGDFGLVAVQQHVAGLEKHAPPRSIRPAPVSTSEPEIVSMSQAAAPDAEAENISDFL